MQNEGQLTGRQFIRAEEEILLMMITSLKGKPLLY